MGHRPKPNGADGRDAGGRFAPGNTGGPGNPYARKVGRLRSLMIDAVTDDDLRAIVAKLVERARAGDLPAAREVLNRLMGKPDYGPDPDRLDLDAVKLDAELRQAQDGDRWAGLLGR